MSSRATDSSDCDSSTVLRDGVAQLLRGLGEVVGADDVQLEALLIDAERAVNMIQAVQAQAMVALEQRAREADAALPVSVSYLAGRREEGVVDQISTALQCTRAAASRRYEIARGAYSHPSLASVWRLGAIDERKVSVICDGLKAAAPVDDASLVTGAIGRLAAEAADYAASHTSPQVKSWLDRRVIAIDPGAAERRHERASSRRHVQLNPLSDGMAELISYLPAVQARQAFDILTAAAHASDGPDEHRTLDQRRADSLIDLLCGRGAPPQVTVQVTIDGRTLLGANDQPVELTGFGPISAGAARRLLARTDPLYHRLITTPVGSLAEVDPKTYRPTASLETFIRARDYTCRFPGCRRPASSSRSGVDLDHTVPWPAGGTTPDNLAALCRHHHRVKHSPGWNVTLNDDGAMAWTTPGGRRIVTHAWRYTDPPPE